MRFSIVLLNRWKKNKGLQTYQSFISFITTSFTYFHTHLCRLMSFRWFITPFTIRLSCWWGLIWRLSNHFNILPFRWLTTFRSLSASRWNDGFRWLMEWYPFFLSHRKHFPSIVVKPSFRWIVALLNISFNYRKPILSVADETSELSPKPLKPFSQRRGETQLSVDSGLIEFSF